MLYENIRQRYNNRYIVNTEIRIMTKLLEFKKNMYTVIGGATPLHHFTRKIVNEK